jgi:hypothetical protein
MSGDGEKRRRKKRAWIVKVLAIISIITLLCLSSLFIWYGDFMPKTPARVVSSFGEITFENVSYEVHVRFLDHDGEMYAGMPYKCGIFIYPQVNDGVVPNVTFKMMINNAAFSTDTSNLLPDYFDVPVQGPIFYTNRTVTFQSSGTGVISLLASNQTDNAKFSLDQTITIEPWSSFYQIEATKVSAITNMLAVGFAVGAIVASLPLGKWMGDEDPKG